MKKILILLLLPALLLCGCGKTESSGGLSVVATTYPVYEFALAVTEGAENVSVTLMIDQQISCLHDYTLSVNDMKAVEEADILLINGAELEIFLDDALASHGELPVCDCSGGVELLPGEERKHDPHIWLDPANAAIMANNIAEALGAADADNAELFSKNAAAFSDEMTALKTELSETMSGISCRELITFHDGFGYFADAFDLDILRAVEEESGSEASARELAELVALIDEHKLPAIFTEKNGSTSSAEAISRETGVKVLSLDMIMSGGGEYAARMRENAAAIAEGLS